ncbi:MAG: YfcE family phosphodiesterase [Eubacterium sp.]|nr:YfcE family phosphodiesterase [Eubacterium sp.]
MRLVVTADSHRDSRDFFNVLDRHEKNADLFINLGDSEHELELLEMTRPDIKIECVAGNNDWHSNLPFYKMLTCSGKKVLITHGHTFHVKYGLGELKDFARREGADIVLFAHTHEAYTDYEDGIYYMNPGAICHASYGIVDIVGDGVITYTNRI